MHALSRILLRFLFSAMGLLAASGLIPGIHHGAFTDLLAVAVILGFLNATLGALLKFIAFLPVACSFGCLSLVINGLIFWWAGRLAQGLGLVFSVDGFWDGFWGALVASLVGWLLERAFLGPGTPPTPPPRGIKQIN
jgi:putative membrane protein